MQQILDSGDASGAGMRRRGNAFIWWASWAYLVLVATLWLTMYFSGDRWWPATVFLFGPRWVALAPLIFLLPAAVWKSSRSLFPLLAAAVIVLGPVMRLCIPTGKAGPSAGPVFHVLTCNVDNGNFNAAALGRLIRETKADIVALQECPKELKLDLQPSWLTLREGELAVLSRYPMRSLGVIKAFQTNHKWPRACMLQCVVETPSGLLNFITVHLPSPRYGLQTIIDRNTILSPSRKGLLEAETSYRRQTSQEVSRIAATMTRPIIIAGDFNMTVDSTIYRQYWKGYGNAFSEVGFGYGWTVWGGPRGMKTGARIDHVLAGEGLQVLACDMAADVGSDHRPLIAHIVMAANRK